MAKKTKSARSKKAKRIGTVPRFDNVRLTPATTAARMAAVLERQHQLQFAVKWPKSSQLVLMSLQVKASDGLFKELLQHPLGGNTGDLVVDMGTFEPGEIKVGFIMNALTAIKQAATFIVEDKKVTDFKPAPGQPLKSLKQGEGWSETDKYQVGKTV